VLEDEDLAASLPRRIQLRDGRIVADTGAQARADAVEVVR